VFRGVSHITMDAKGRLAFPARVREKLHESCQGQIVATIDTQSRCLLIYPMPAWEAIERQIQELPSMNQAVRRFQRLVIGYATDLEFDSAGRVLLPPSLREYAGLEKKLVLAGQGKKLELWDEAGWLAEIDQSKEDTSVPEELMGIVL
jgi:MraZ protein